MILFSRYRQKREFFEYSSIKDNTKLKFNIYLAIWVEMCEKKLVVKFIDGSKMEFNLDTVDDAKKMYEYITKD